MGTKAENDILEIWADQYRQRAKLLNGFSNVKVLKISPYPDLSTLSLHLADSRRISSTDIIKFEKRILGKHKRSFLYLSFVLDAGASDSRLKKMLTKQGFKLAVDTNINFFSKQRPCELPAGFSVRIAEFLNPKTFKEYGVVSKAVWGDVSYFLKQNARLIRANKIPVYTVVIHNRQNKPVATGCVSVGSKSALFFGGCVISKYRRKGIWTALTAYRQMIANSDSKKTCLLFTDQKTIRESNDRHYRFLTFKKE